MKEANRKRLTELRNLLLEMHKMLLERERAAYESEHGPIGGPAAFLNLLIEDPHFAWLRKISTLVVEIDEALSPRSEGDDGAAEALVAQVRELIRLDGAAVGEFQGKYAEAVRTSAEIAAKHGAIERVLGESVS